MELFRTLGALIEPPTPHLANLAELLELGPLPEAHEHADLFLFQLYPYASVYLGAEGQLGGEARDRIAGFWRALDLTPPKEPDDLAVMLAFYAELCGQEENAHDDVIKLRWQQARAAFLGEHLLSWLPLWLANLQRVAPPFYRAWGILLSQALDAESKHLETHTTPPLPLHLREAPTFPEIQGEDSEEFLQALLSPVRSGMILVRDDLRRAAQDLQIGTRIGERKFVLKALLAQKPKALLSWLADEADRQARHLQQQAQPLHFPMSFWIGRLEHTAETLRLTTP